MNSSSVSFVSQFAPSSPLTSSETKALVSFRRPRSNSRSHSHSHSTSSPTRQTWTSVVSPPPPPSAPLHQQKPSHVEPLHVSSQDELHSILQQPAVITVLKVYSRGCRSCMRIKRPFERINAKYLPTNSDKTTSSLVQCIQLCADESEQHQLLAQQLGVRGFPTFILFRHGKRVDHFASSSSDVIEQAITDNL